MGLRERLDTLQPRERRLLNILVAVFVVIVVLLLPIGVSAMLANSRSKNEELREAIERLLAERDQIQERNDKNQGVLARYKNQAPALASFIDSHAKQLSLEIPEFKDRPAVPHGKDYEERATDIRIKSVNMRPLVLFLERIPQSQYPISITKLNVRRRGTEPDEWEAAMTVSAFHRIAPATKVDKPASEPKTP
jgi:general secretion pathway protein M